MILLVRNGISERTVFRFLQSATFPERKGRSDRGRSLLAPYKKYLLERWNNGFHNTTKLWQEIQQQGYQGSYATVAGYTRRLRDAQELKTGEKNPNQPLPKVFEPEKISVDRTSSGGADFKQTRRTK